MKQLIAQQVQFILLMTISGMSLMAGYDLLRLIRWLFPHGQISIAIEDILYWIAVSVPVFYLFLEFHDGIIRWYGLVAVFSGIVLYEYGLSRPVRNKIAAFFNRIRRKWRKKRARIRETRRQKRQKKLEVDQERRRQRREQVEREKRQRQEQREEKRRQRQEQTEREERKRQEQREEKRRQRQEQTEREERKRQEQREEKRRQRQEQTEREERKKQKQKEEKSVRDRRGRSVRSGRSRNRKRK